MSNDKGGGGTGPSGTPSALERYLAKQKEQRAQKVQTAQDSQSRDAASKGRDERPKSGAATSEERTGARSKFKHTTDPSSIPRPDSGEVTPSSIPRPSEQPSSLGRWDKFGEEAPATSKAASMQQAIQPQENEDDEEDIFEKRNLSSEPQSEFRVPPEIGTRLLALIIDWVVVFCFSIPVTKATAALLSIAFGPIVDRHTDGLDTVASFLVIYFYYGYFYSKKGASPGKLLFNLEVIDAETGKYLTPWKAFFREAIGKFISAIPFGMGYLIAAFRQDRRALHDLLFDTHVVSKKP